MSTQTTPAGVNRVGATVIVLLVLVGMVTAVASLFAGAIIVVPLVLMFGPILIIGWYAIHQRPENLYPPVERRPLTDDRRR